MPDTPDVGDPAPDFTLPSTQGPIHLKERLAQRAVLLVFYPGDDTPVCTKQLCDYRDNLSVFGDLGVDVLGVNPQPLASHEAFARKFSLPFPLVSDEDKSVCHAYGTLSFLGYAQRALVLVGRDGKIKYKRSDFPMFRRSAEELREVISGLAL